MADSRELTFGMDFGLEDAINRLSETIDRLEGIVDTEEDAEEAGQRIGSGIRAGAETGASRVGALTDSISRMRGAAGEAGDAGRDMGQRIEDGANTGEDGIRNLSDSVRRAINDIEGTGDTFRNTFRAMGAQSESLGQSIAKTMGTALKDGNSTAKGLRAGFEGAIGYTQKKFTGLVSNFKTGAKNIGTAFTHPIRTIKDKLGAALLSAADDADDLGDSADAARKDLDDMGDAGSEAGDQIKDALKGALAAVIGLEAIKSGIDKLKELGAAALEAAGAAENTAKKFDACFSGTDAADWVNNYSDAVHRNVSEVKSFMVSNKAMYAELGITGEAAADLSKITTSLAYDLGNAFSMDDAEALGVLQDYINGNTSALEEYGVHIDDVALKNAALEMGLGSQLDALDDAALAQVRMNALLGQTEKIQQGAINSTDGLVNKTKALNGIWGNFMGEAGSRFTPVLEGLYGVILDNWPTIEPMLLQFVDILSNGMEQSVPVLMELGQTLIPVLTEVLGTLFEAGLPLLSVFGDLAQTVLPPVASMVSLLAETVVPPLVEILTTLNTSIIQPLIPAVQKIAEALLPPIAQLLGAISPILEAISPVLSFIGDVLGIIADVLGKVIGWLADGVSKVTNFFSNLFGGAKDSKEAVDDLSGAVSGLDEVTGKETSLAVDTSEYQEEVKGAAEATSKAVAESTDAAKEITDVNFMAMGASATAAYGTMKTDAETAWSSMTAAAEAGADRIVEAFTKISTAAREASNASSIQVGADIPHNARGTDNFKGGPTWMNEEGGELAILPGGSAIIPADETDRLMQSFSNTTNNTTNVNTNSHHSSRSVMVAPEIKIVIEGRADDQAVSNIEERLRALFRDLYQEAQEQDYTDRAMQSGFA